MKHAAHALMLHCKVNKLISYKTVYEMFLNIKGKQMMYILLNKFGDKKVILFGDKKVILFGDKKVILCFTERIPCFKSLFMYCGSCNTDK